MPADWKAPVLGLAAVLGVVGTSIPAYWKARVNVKKQGL
jgi:hypothetical protein